MALSREDVRAQECNPTSFLEMPPTTALLVSVIMSLLLPFPGQCLFCQKNTELACHIAILTGPGGARAAICPTTTEFFSSTVRVCFPVLIWNCGSCSHPSIPATASGAHSSPHPTLPVILPDLPLPLVLFHLPSLPRIPVMWLVFRGHCQLQGSLPSGRQRMAGDRLGVLGSSGLIPTGLACSKLL